MRTLCRLCGKDMKQLSKRVGCSEQDACTLHRAAHERELFDRMHGLLSRLRGVSRINSDDGYTIDMLAANADIINEGLFI